MQHVRPVHINVIALELISGQKHSSAIGGNLFFEKSAMQSQTILVGAKSSLHGYATPETGVVQDGYFQLYGEFESNTGPQGSPCTHTYRVKQNTKFYINKVGPGDWRV